MGYIKDVPKGGEYPKKLCYSFGDKTSGWRVSRDSVRILNKDEGQRRAEVDSKLKMNRKILPKPQEKVRDP